VSNDYKSLASSILAKVDDRATAADSCAQSLRISLSWLKNELHDDCSHDLSILLNGCYGSAMEAVCLISFGLVRPAVSSLRSHYELFLRYLYYRDHPVEWDATKSYRAKSKLPGEIKKYFSEYFPDYKSRMTALEKCKNRSFVDCYDILSGIVHGSALNSIAGEIEMLDLVEKIEVVNQAVPIFEGTSECLSDICFALYSNNYPSLPTEAKKSLECRLSKKEIKNILDV